MTVQGHAPGQYGGLPTVTALPALLSSPVILEMVTSLSARLMAVSQETAKSEEGAE